MTMQMLLSEGQISDLFFNYDHPQYAALYPKTDDKKNTGPTQEEIVEAITKDAEDFATCYPTDESKDDMVAWLVKNFMHRL
jgi:hypothetical protein